MTSSGSPSALPAQRLALDLQRSQQALRVEQDRSRVLLSELERLQEELDRVRGSVTRESNIRLQAEEELDETRERLQLAVDAAGLALWDFREPFRDVYLTARWGELLGDIAMEGYWDIRMVASRVHPEDLARVRAELRRVLKGEVERGSVRYRFRVRDGHWIWLETHGRVTERAIDGRATRLMGTHADVTERAAVEARAQEAKLLAEQSSRAKSEFLANMSHEVRTPLNAIMGLNRLLLDSRIDDEQRHWLGLVSESADALLAILNDVLDLSRIEAGKLSLDPVAVDLKALLRSVFNTYAGQTDKKRLQWQLSLDPAVPDWLLVDPLRLRQILNNLLSNAQKFTDAGGQVGLFVDTAEEQGQAFVRIRVTDSGVGIERDKQASIFEAFVQADASTARRFGGSGLGLAICARLVKMMGGSIAVTSEPGRGSCFEVCLPVRIPVGSANQSAQGVRSTSAADDESWEGVFPGLSVLLVEDNSTNLLFMQKLLQRMGCVVSAAQDGESAISEWQKHRPDLILMDVQMPGINGFTATARIREIERRESKPPVPIIALTANAMLGDREACLSADMEGYVAKPVQVTQLVHVMRRALQPAGGIAPDTKAVAVAPSGPDANHPLVADREPSPVVAMHTKLGLSEEEMRELAEGLVTDLDDRIRLLLQAGQERDGKSAGRQIHLLIGSLQFMQADRATRIAKGLDMAQRANEWGLFSRALPLLRDELVGLRAAMVRYLA